MTVKDVKRKTRGSSSCRRRRRGDHRKGKNTEMISKKDAKTSPHVGISKGSKNVENSLTQRREKTGRTPESQLK